MGEFCRVLLLLLVLLSGMLLRLAKVDGRVENNKIVILLARVDLYDTDTFSLSVPTQMERVRSIFYIVAELPFGIRPQRYDISDIV